MVNETTKYDNVMICLCNGRRKCVVTEENPKDSSKFVFPEEVLSLANNPTFLRVGHKKNISAGEYCECLLKTQLFLLLLLF